MQFYCYSQISCQVLAPKQRSNTPLFTSTSQTADDATSESYQVIAYKELMLDPALKYTIHTLDFDATDKQELQQNPEFIPSPKIQSRFSHSFHLPVASEIM